MKASPFVATVASLTMASPGIAETAPEPLKPSTLWQVDYADRECRLTRTFGSGKDAIFFRLARGSSFDRYDIMLAGMSIPNKTGKVDISVTLEPQNATENFKGQNLPVPKHKEHVLRWFDGPTDGIDTGPNNQVMVVTAGKAKPIRLKLEDFRNAIAAMKTCHDDLLQSWKIDPASLASLKSLPIPAVNPGAWATTTDYPPEALQAGQSGDVGFKLKVGVDGKPKDCLIIESSNVPKLDEATCRTVLARARFKPATGADGLPVEAPYLNRIRWRIPD